MTEPYFEKLKFSQSVVFCVVECLQNGNIGIRRQESRVTTTAETIKKFKIV